MYNRTKGNSLFFQKYFFVWSKYTYKLIFMKIALKLTVLLAKIGKKLLWPTFIAATLYVPIAKKEVSSYQSPYLDFFPQNLLSIVDTYKLGLKLNNKQFLDTNYLKLLFCIIFNFK